MSSGGVSGGGGVNDKSQKTNGNSYRFPIVIAISVIAVSLCFLSMFAGDMPITKRSGSSGQHVALRDFPYPYSAMAAIVNDCDNLTLRAFERYHRFLNTRSETIYGPGLGLDVSDSFFAYTAAGDYNLVMTYFLGTDQDTLKDARKIAFYSRCGWIDTLHAYGDFSAAAGQSAVQPTVQITGQPAAQPAAQPPAQPAGQPAVQPTAQITGQPAAQSTTQPAAQTLFTRGRAIAAADALLCDGIFPIIWTDHGNEGNVQNFGSYSPLSSDEYKCGDAPASSNYYHTDVTVPAGIKYIWNAKRSDRFGYDFPLEARTLRDGRKVWAFSRYTGTTAGAGGAGVGDVVAGGGVGYDDAYGTGVSGAVMGDVVADDGVGSDDAYDTGVSGAGVGDVVAGGAGMGDVVAGGAVMGGVPVWDWYPDRLRYEITEEKLSALVQNRQYGLFAQHLGYYGEDYVYDAEDVGALRLLADYQHARGEILVAGTARLLEYATAQRYVSYTVSSVAANGTTEINILSIDDPLFQDTAPSLDRVRGLTFYCDDPENARIAICGSPIDERDVRVNAPDDTGRPSISICWYETDVTDYSSFA